jgi:hypothetical protein
MIIVIDNKLLVGMSILPEKPSLVESVLNGTLPGVKSSGWLLLPAEEADSECSRISNVLGHQILHRNQFKKSRISHFCF